MPITSDRKDEYLYQNLWRAALADPLSSGIACGVLGIGERNSEEQVIRYLLRIMRREWRLLVAGGVGVLLCHATGVILSILCLDPFLYFAIAILAPFVLFGGLSVWFFFKASVLPLEVEILEAWRQAAEQDDAKSRNLGRFGVFWFVAFVSAALALPVQIVLVVALSRYR